MKNNERIVLDLINLKDELILKGEEDLSLKLNEIIKDIEDNL